ncbi:unnamed protein product [Calypogeia fissa]
MKRRNNNVTMQVGGNSWVKLFAILTWSPGIHAVAQDAVWVDTSDEDTSTKVKKSTKKRLSKKKIVSELVQEATVPIKCQQPMGISLSQTAQTPTKACHRPQPQVWAVGGDGSILLWQHHSDAPVAEANCVTLDYLSPLPTPMVEDSGLLEDGSVVGTIMGSCTLSQIPSQLNAEYVNEEVIDPDTPP